MSLTARDYAENAQELCVLPDIYTKLKSMLDDDNTSLDDIADVISLEPALASKLLKIANSAMFNFPREIDSISRALRVLGLQEVHNLLDAYGVTAAFSGIDSSVLDLDKFWEISVDCALMVKFFAKHKRIASSGLFLSGLFHVIGELAMVHSEHEKIRFCETMKKGETPWQRQQQAFGFTFADVSVELLRQWQLPELIIMPIAEYNLGYTEELDTGTALLYVASRLAVCNSHPGLYQKERLIGQHVMSELELTSEDLNEAIDYCNAEGMQIMSVLNG